MMRKPGCVVWSCHPPSVTHEHQRFQWTISTLERKSALSHYPLRCTFYHGYGR